MRGVGAPWTMPTNLHTQILYALTWISIVAVHGLNGHREETWKAQNGKLWLRDFLPQDVPDARIMTFGYNAATHSSSAPLSQNALHNHGETLVRDLARKRRQISERPIIFVAHSLGGLVVKSALIYANGEKADNNNQNHSIRKSTTGIVFIGTPHLGSKDASMAKLMLNIASLVMTTNNKMLDHLEQASESLDQQRTQFAQQKDGIRTMYCYEEYETKIGKGILGKLVKVLVVPKQSAVIQEEAGSEALAIPQDHRGIARFAGRDEKGYDGIQDCIVRWMQDAAAQEYSMIRSLVKSMCSTLHFDEMHSRFFEVKDRTPETPRSWLFEADTYRDWDKSDTSLLILTGKPGSGKTALLNMALGFANKDRCNGTVPLYFFFHESQDANTTLNSALGMYRTILHQALSSGLPISARILSRYKEYKKNNWTVHSLQSATDEILSGLTSPKKRTRIFLDALDECQKDDISAILKHLGRLVTTTTRIKVLISARDLSRYSNFLPESTQTLVVHENNDDDIRTYVRVQLKKPEEEQAETLEATVAQRLKKEQAERLAETITQQAKGVFLWVCQIVDSVKTDMTDSTTDEILDHVKQFPDMSHIYERMITRCPKEQRPETVALLQLIVFSQKPLNLAQMRQAFCLLTPEKPKKVTCEENTEALEKVTYEKKLASWSAPGLELNFRNRLSNILLGLVEYKSQGSNGQGSATPAEEAIYVQLIHGTARTYLLEKGLAILSADLETHLEPKSHLTILKLCLRLIHFQDLSSQLGAYASSFWPRHAQESDTLLLADDAIDLPRDVHQCPRASRKPVLAKRYQDQHEHRRLPNTLLLEGETSLLVLMASAGCSNLALRHARKCSVCVPRRRDGATSGTTPEAIGSDAASRALFQAVVNKNLSTVRLFAQHPSMLPADPNYLFSTPPPEAGPGRFQSTAFYKACYGGYANIVRVLLDMGADVSRQIPANYRTGLHAAAACGRLNVLEAIFDHASNQQQGSPRRLFSLAADVGDVGRGVTALHIAVYYGQTETVEWLIHRLEDTMDNEGLQEVIGLRTLDGRTAVDIAVEEEEEGILDLLE